MERRLGRGLGALLPDSGRARNPREIDLDEIRPNPFQPRTKFRPSGLDELRQSITNHGILQPVVVRKVEEGFELISGERRWRASRQAGLRAIPAIVRANVSDADMLELALVENVQREDLNPIEKALGYRRMIDELELTQEKVAERVGLKRSTVANHLRLLELPQATQDAVSEGTLSMGHARALLAIQDRDRLAALASDVVEQNLSVRDVERLVREESGKEPASSDAGEGSSTERPSSAKRGSDERTDWVGPIERRIQEHLGTRVSIRNGSDYRGQIVIEYFDRDDLERLIGVLAPQDELE